MFTTIDALHRPRRTTALMRALALLFLAALVFATLFPMSGWTADITRCSQGYVMGICNRAGSCSAATTVFQFVGVRSPRSLEN